MDKEKNRPEILTDKEIKKEIGKLTKLFKGIDDERMKSLVSRQIEEAAFLCVACRQAKEELKAEGLTTETKNASQIFIKAHPATTIYEKYSRQYTQIVNQLIEYLPPEEKKTVSKLVALRHE